MFWDHCLFFSIRDEAYNVEQKKSTTGGVFANFPDDG